MSRTFSEVETGVQVGRTYQVTQLHGIGSDGEHVVINGRWVVTAILMTGHSSCESHCVLKDPDGIRSVTVVEDALYDQLDPWDR